MPQYRTIIKPQDDVLEYDLNFNECNNEIQCNETNFSNNFVKSNEEMCYSEDGVGYLCSVCNRLFVNYFLYDEHFERSKKCLNQALPDPIEIEVSFKLFYLKNNFFLLLIKIGSKCCENNLII